MSILFILDQLPTLQDLADSNNNIHYRRRLVTLSDTTLTAILQIIHNLKDNEQLAKTLARAEKRYFKKFYKPLAVLTSDTKNRDQKLKLLASLGLVFLKRILRPVARYLRK